MSTSDEKKFDIGDRVAVFVAYENEKNVVGGKPYYNEDEDLFFYGKVSDISRKGKITVEWDEHYMNDCHNEPLDASILMTEEAAKQLSSRLEQEFNAVEVEIKAKMTEASKLIEEAAEMAEKIGLELSNMSAGRSPLYGAMRAGGWRTSSFNC